MLCACEGCERFTEAKVLCPLDGISPEMPRCSLPEGELSKCVIFHLFALLGRISPCAEALVGKGHLLAWKGQAVALPLCFSLG